MSVWTEAQRLSTVYGIPVERVEALILEANGDVHTAHVACMKISEGATLDEAKAYCAGMDGRRAAR